MSPVPQLLVIEDDAALRRSLLLTLVDEGFDVADAATGREGLRRVDEQPDALLLDLGLPDVDGFVLCQQLRARTPSPILVLSVQRAPDDVARALAAGADDYLAKPFPTASVAQRVRALLVPGGAPPDGAPALTRTEARLLEELVAVPGAVVAQDALLERVWGVRPAAGVAALAARVDSLRGKLAAGGATVTAAGDGYRLDRP